MTDSPVAELPLHIDSTMILYRTLCGLLDYDRDAGLLFWKKDMANGKIKAGSIAGTLHSSGYIRIQIKLEGKVRALFAHQLIWFMEYGKVPNEIDHKNRAGTDNRYWNLRDCTHSQNGMNRKLGKNSASGVKGVSFHSRYNKWQAYIYRNYKRFHIGTFDSKEEAIEARRKVEADIFGGFGGGHHG